MIKKLSYTVFIVLLVIVNAYTQPPQIIELINKVNRDSLALYIRQLSGDTSCIIGGSPYTILSRHKDQPGNDKAAQYIYEKFQSFGLQVQYETFSATGKNVIATKPGLSGSQRYFIVCGHYDDMPSGAIAPGADDNASGTATVLELARIFSQYNFNFTIRFICFDEEEQGLIGSRYYATQARNRNDSIIGVINLDMTGYDANNDGIVDVHSNSVANTAQIANEWVNNIYQYGVALTPRTVPSQPYSDHHSFHLRNYGAILVIEYDLEFNPRYHTVNDRFQFLNMNYAHKIAQVTAATAAEFAQILDVNLFTLNTSPDWNLLSIPIQTNDGRRSILFPTATSLAYTYDNAYVVSDTIFLGKGYWLKFNTTQSHQIQGQNVSQLQIPVKTGWNLIGTLNSNIPVASISTQPPNIISSLFFGYSGSYSPANTLNPGKGYWVKVSQNGNINLVSSFNKITNESNYSISNFDYELNFISGHKVSKLFLVSDISNPEKFELPPLPPANMFDVRFSNNSFVERLSEDEKIILINNENLPVKFSLKSNNADPFLVKYFKNGFEEKIIVSEGDVITLDEKIQMIKVQKISIPKEFVLYQNYPNPFNPVTKIQFNIPEQSHVILSIYNIQGRLLETLINRTLDKGFYSIDFDGSEYPSGVYFYELKSRGFSTIKKMVLVK